MNNKPAIPASILRSEFIASLTDLINHSSLPAFIIEPILKDFYLDIKAISQKQLEEDMETYRNAVKNFEENNASENE